MAIPLTTYLDDQTEYHGLDIVEPMVAWCVENITARFPNFKFHHVSLKNSLYSSKAELSAATYKFPFPDEYFDFVFLTSVFTHLKPSDTKNYLKEVQRVLKINGRVLMSFYLITADYRTNRRKQNGRALITFDYGFYPYWFNERKVPEAIAGYDEGYVFRQIRTSGLSMEAVYYGGWNGNRGLTWQDIIIASRRT
jgi:ubiquinone/menaquinone biosynthesis C-methylase UbiE